MIGKKIKTFEQLMKTELIVIPHRSMTPVHREWFQNWCACNINSLLKGGYVFKYEKTKK